MRTQTISSFILTLIVLVKFSWSQLSVTAPDALISKIKNINGNANSIKI